MIKTLESKFETIDRGAYCGQKMPIGYVIDDQLTWERVWEATNISIPTDTLPEIDFTKEMVIGAYLGQTTSGGYSIEISNIVDRIDSLEVYLTEKAPAPGSMTTDGLTQPYHLVKTAKNDKNVVFIRKFE
tara:strand:- start:891 stop:1280 length:390 start_codon:yes stop_codon:yes gene_type:complete